MAFGRFLYKRNDFFPLGFVGFGPTSSQQRPLAEQTILAIVRQLLYGLKDYGSYRDRVEDLMEARALSFTLSMKIIS